MMIRVPRSARTAAISLTLGLLLAGCNKTAAPAGDSALTSQVQNRITGDGSLSGQPIQASVAQGVVTLNGSVNSAAARSLASDDAAKVPGIRTVINNLTVQPGLGTTAVVSPAPAPIPTIPAKKSSAAILPRQRGMQGAPIERAGDAPQTYDTAQNQPPQQQQEMPPPPPPPSAAPVIHNLTLAAGSTLPVRVTQTLDSATTQTGDRFTGVLASDIIVDGIVALPQGTPVTGHVDTAHDAGHFSGNSLLTVSLSGLTRHGERIAITTDPYTVEGKGRGKNTAEKVGGGAAVGAILGGIFGGGKGAAIGAAAGGGVGAGANGVTRGQQVQIVSETLVRFRLTNAVTVHVGGRAEDRPDADRPALNR